MGSEWVENHRRLVGVALLLLAGLNAWIACAIFPWHPYLASANGAMAIILVPGVTLTWNLQQPAEPRPIWTFDGLNPLATLPRDVAQR